MCAGSPARAGRLRPRLRAASILATKGRRHGDAELRARLPPCPGCLRGRLLLRVAHETRAIVLQTLFGEGRAHRHTGQPILGDRRGWYRRRGPGARPPRSLSAIAPTLVALALAGAIGCEAGLRRRCDELCARYGLCTPGGDGVCVAAGEDCARSDDCRVFGLCSARGGRCEAMRDEPCARSERCRDEARCAARDGACVAATPSCQASAACREDGFCSAVDGRCRARSDADCARSSACSRDHRCRAAALRCVN